MKTRILYLSTVDTTVHTFLIPHIKALQAKGYEAEVACNLKRWRDCFRQLGITAHHLPLERRVVSWRNIRAYFQLMRLLAQQHYDIVHVHTPVAAFWGRLAAHRAGIKTLYTAHGFHFFRGGNPFKNAFFFALERLAACWTDALIVINREDHDIAKRFRLAPPQRLFWVLGVGIDVEKYRPDGLSPEEKMALKAELGCEGKVVGMIGEFNPGKRHIDLLQAAERVWIKRPGVTFLLIGRGPLLSKLRRRMEASLYRDKVKFLGSVSDVSRLLNIMDVFVLPSVREGLPRSVQEAMAAEVPVVAADTRGNRDLVQHGKTGLLVPPLCPSRLAEAILHILGDKELARRLGKRGRQLAIEKLALERVVPQIVEIHERLLEGSHHVSNDVK